MSQSIQPYALQGLRLRQLRREDAGDIMVMQEAVLLDLPDPLWYYPSSQEAFAACCAQGECFGYYAPRRLAGFATLTPGFARPERCYAHKLGLPPEGTYDVQDVMVHPAYRRRGIHSALLALFQETARRVGGHTLLATIAPDNLPSTASFEKAGFTYILTMPAYDGRPRSFYQKVL